MPLEATNGEGWQVSKWGFLERLIMGQSHSETRFNRLDMRNKYKNKSVSL